MLYLLHLMRQCSPLDGHLQWGMLLQLQQTATATQVLCAAYGSRLIRLC